MIPTTEDGLRRAGVDGRFAFGVAILLCGIGFLALMDRLGVPDGLVRALAVLFVLLGLAVIAALLRTMRVSWFYAAGRAMPAPYAGLAMAALSAALFLPFMPPVPAGLSFSEIFAGFACGIGCAALLTGPLLRKTGAFSIPDLIAARFPRLAARLGAILLTGTVASLIALAGFQEALHALSGWSGLGLPLSAAILCLLLCFMILPGGLAGTLWAATAAAVVALAVYGLPLLIMSLHGERLALPGLGDPVRWATALGLIESWTGFAPAKQHMDPVLIGVIALGLGVLAPLLAPSIACRDRAAAQRAGLTALLWGAILLVLAAITVAEAGLNLDQAVFGKAADRLPESLYRASGDGRLQICGAPVPDKLAARRACASRPGLTSGLAPRDLSMKSTFLLESFAEFGGFGSAFSGLAEAALLALGVVLAAIGIQCAATILGNDLFYRVRDHSALTSRRLAVTRAFAILLIALAGGGLGFFAINPQILIGLALVLSVAGLAPLLLMTLWPRATSFDASVALLVGLLAAEGFIEMHPLAAGLDRFALSALMACGCGLAAGIATSFMRRGSPDGLTFTRTILNERGEWLHPDKGV